MKVIEMIDIIMFFLKETSTIANPLNGEDSVGL